MKTLETDRLLLRMFRESDLDAYAEMCADLEVVRYLGDGRPMSRAEAWRHIAMIIGHWQIRGFGLWAVEERATQKLIGRIGCWMPEGWPELEIGWMLGRDHWGRGFATEAAFASLDYAFSELHAPHIISFIQPANTNSIRVAERLGERLEGRTELMTHEVLVYGMDRSMWEGKRDA